MIKKTSICVAATAILLTILFVRFQHRTVSPKKATLNDVMVEAKNGNYRIISTAELADRLQKEPEAITLIDTRQEWEYRTGHIVNARNFPMEPTWWSRWRNGSDLNDFLGPDKDSTLVFY